MMITDVILMFSVTQLILKLKLKKKNNRECAMTIGNKHFAYSNANKEDAELAK